MSRINLPQKEELTPEQLEIFDRVVSGPRGQMIGPLRAAIHSPELAKRWEAFGEYVRYNTVIPHRCKELAITVTGRRWSSQVEWWIHAKEALNAGVEENIISALKEGISPSFDNHADYIVYEYTRQSLECGKPDGVTYSQVLDLWGEKGVVELTAVIGYYTLVALTLNAHEIPLPDGITSQLTPPNEGLFQIAKAIKRKETE